MKSSSVLQIPDRLMSLILMNLKAFTLTGIDPEKLIQNFITFCESYRSFYRRQIQISIYSSWYSVWDTIKYSGFRDIYTNIYNLVSMLNLQQKLRADSRHCKF